MDPSARITTNQKGNEGDNEKSGKSWSCCQCLDGLWDFDIFRTCTDCQHERCLFCTLSGKGKHKHVNEEWTDFQGAIQESIRDHLKKGSSVEDIRIDLRREFPGRGPGYLPLSVLERKLDEWGYSKMGEQDTSHGTYGHYELLLNEFHQNRGTTLVRLIDNEPLKYYQLKHAVDRRGGFDVLSEIRQWMEVASELGYDLLPYDDPYEDCLSSRTRAPVQGLAKKKPVESTHAVDFAEKVKNYFGSQLETYEQFLEILETYKSESKPIQEFYAQITQLFGDAPNLVEEFKQCLPESVAQSLAREAEEETFIAEPIVERDPSAL